MKASDALLAAIGRFLGNAGIFCRRIESGLEQDVYS